MKFDFVLEENYLALVSCFLGPQLKIVATMSVGYEHIDLEACKKRKIAVTHTPFVSTESVAELTLTLLLYVARRIPDGKFGHRIRQQHIILD